MVAITEPRAGAISVVNGSLLPPGIAHAGTHSRVWFRRGFVVRAADESSGSVIGQTPTSPIEKTSTDKSPGSVVGQTPTSPIEKTSTDKSPGSVVGQTPTSPIEKTSTTTTTPKAREPAPLQKGGEAAGKDPAPSTLGQTKNAAAASAAGDEAGKFDDPRWRAGTWDIAKFTSNGKINWDAVIDAEVARRKWLEANPEASNNSEPVVFDTATVPWWAWVKRFHLPEAELLNGRAAMVGYAVGYLVDSATGAGLVDQQNTFLGKTLLLITVLAVLLIRKNSDVANLRTIVKESTFYDKQWQATWKDDDDADDNNKKGGNSANIP